MLSVETADEYSFLQGNANIDASIQWMGASDLASEGMWVWDSGNPVTLNHWKPGKPDNNGYNVHCMAVNMDWGTWTWEDINCDHQYRSVCEIDLSLY